MIRETVNALVACVVTFVLCAVAYPAAVWGLGQLAFPEQAEGSLVYGRDGTVIGSELIAQPFASDDVFPPPALGGRLQGRRGRRLEPRDQEPRPAQARSSERAEALKATRGGIRSPVDLVTASGGGLDPHISPEAAHYQAARVAAARKLPVGPRPGPDRRAHRAVGGDHRRPAAGQRPEAQPRPGRGEARRGRPPPPRRRACRLRRERVGRVTQARRDLAGDLRGPLAGDGAGAEVKPARTAHGSADVAAIQDPGRAAPEPRPARSPGASGSPGIPRTESRRSSRVEGTRERVLAAVGRGLPPDGLQSLTGSRSSKIDERGSRTPARRSSGSPSRAPRRPRGAAHG